MIIVREKSIERRKDYGKRIYCTGRNYYRKRVRDYIKKEKEESNVKYIEFEQSRPLDIIIIGRIAIDFNPAWNEQVKEEFGRLKNVHIFEKFLGGSPANIAVGVSHHGMKGSTAYTCDGKSFSIKPFPVNARKGFGGGDGYGSGFLYGIYQGWEIQDCLEFGSAEASMMVKSNNCSDALPNPEEVKAFIKEEKEKYGEMIAVM